MNYSVRTPSQLRPILQGFRKSAGMTQATVAAQLGVTQQTYAQLEADPAAVSVERLIKVLRVLGVEIALTRTETRVESGSTKAAAPRPAATKKTPTKAARRPAQKRAATKKITAKAVAKKLENW